MELAAIDELRLQILPITQGPGEGIFDGVRGLAFGMDRVRAADHVIHMTLRPSVR